MRYKIGEVSKILDIPVETIRFYETKKLINPHKDRYSGYRYYTDRDINTLLDYMRFRKMGFSLLESAEILRQHDWKKFLGNLNDKIDDAEKMARFYELKAIKLKNYKNVVQNIPLLLGEYQEVIRPEGFMYINRRYRDGKVEYLGASESGGVFKSMTENLIFVENVYCLRQEYLESDRNTVEFDVGFTMKKKWMDTLGVQSMPLTERIFPVKSLYTMLIVNDPLHYSKEIFADAFEKMRKFDMRLSGDILGNQIVSIDDSGVKTRYMEVWIPFENK